MLFTSGKKNYNVRQIYENESCLSIFLMTLSFLSRFHEKEFDYVLIFNEFLTSLEVGTLVLDERVKIR